MIEVFEVKTRKQKHDFINFPLILYKNCPYYVPELHSDLCYLFSKKNIYLKQCKQVFFIAYKDGKIAGRIQGILQFASNEKWNQKRLRFTRFDSINDKSVSRALFDALKDFAKSNNLNEIVGPLGYNDLEREGLLIEGFDEMSTFEEQYNYDYYQRLLEDYGFVKEVDWTESKLYIKKEEVKRMNRMAEIVLARSKLHYVKSKSITEFVNKYGNDFFDILDDTYEELYMTVPFTDEMKKKTISGMKLITSTKYVALIKNDKDETVAFGICFPNISKAVHDCKGYLTPLGLLKILHQIKHPTVIDLGLVGVKKEYRNGGVNALILNEIINILSNPHIKYAETNLNLETNEQVVSQWKEFNEVKHKKRRCFVKKI